MLPNLSLNNNVVQNPMHKKRPVPRGIRRSSILNNVNLSPFNKTKRMHAKYTHQKRLNNMKTIRNSIAVQKALRIEEKEKKAREKIIRSAFKAKQLAKNRTHIGSSM